MREPNKPYKPQGPPEKPNFDNWTVHIGKETFTESFDDEEEDDEYYDEPLIPGPITFQNFKDFANKYDVPIENVRFVMNPRAMHIEYYMEGWRDVSTQEMIAKQRAKFDKFVEDYKYEERLIAYNQEVVNYERKLKKYYKYLKDYKVWKAEEDYRRKLRGS